MNNIISRLLILLVIVALLAGCLASCTPDDTCTEHVDANGDNVCDVCGDDVKGGTCLIHVDDNKDNKCDNCGADTGASTEFVDYASQLKFNPNSGRAYSEVTVRYYIDGDTTHFDVDTDIVSSGLLKARYLGINTPESTGSIEPWGKKASKYTKTQLQSAVSIIIESDNETWNVDSTGSRYLVWVWYKTASDTDYRNLNLEILQQGLAFGSNASSNAYSEYTMGALNQAKALKLHVFSKESDPDFYYGDAFEVSLKELKANCEKYEGKLVKFEAVVAKSVGPTIYVEEFDAENDMYFGIQVFAGYGCPILDYFKIGNRVCIIGKLTYYENGGTYQVSALEYKLSRPNDPAYTHVISSGYTPSFNEISIDTLMNGKITLDTYEEHIDETTGETVEVLVQKDFDYGELAHYSTVTMTNLTVKSVWTTESEDEDSASDGALTITCQDAAGNTIKIRTATMLTKIVDGVQVPVVESDFPAGTVISVKGVIDSYKGVYQIKVFQIQDFTFE